MIPRRKAAGQLRELKAQPGQDIIQYGYGQLTATVLREGLLDELRIWLHPVLVGGTDPTSLLAHLGAEATLDLVDLTRCDSSVVILRYQPTGAAPHPDQAATGAHEDPGADPGVEP